MLCTDPVLKNRSYVEQKKIVQENIDLFQQINI